MQWLRNWQNPERCWKNQLQHKRTYSCMAGCDLLMCKQNVLLSIFVYPSITLDSWPASSSILSSTGTVTSDLKSVTEKVNKKFHQHQHWDVVGWVYSVTCIIQHLSNPNTLYTGHIMTKSNTSSLCQTCQRLFSSNPNFWIESTIHL